MLIPIFVLLGIGVMTYLVTTPKQLKSVSSGSVPRQDPKTHNLRLLNRVIKQGLNPSQTLVDRAIAEAYDLGHWGTVEKLSIAFQTQGNLTGETPQPPPTESEKISIVIGKNSPLKGVSNEDWEEFVKKIRTQEPGYKSDKHVGVYHHNRERLIQLGYDNVSLFDLEGSEDLQYQAIEKDMADNYTRQAKLISDYCGDVVSIDGADYPVTASGVLGLLKSAGTKNAESWLTNPDERKAFPHTTKTFLQTNGVF